MPETSTEIAERLIRPEFRALAKSLGDGPLTDDLARAHIDPLFTRAIARRDRTGEIYLANHSLGRPLDATGSDVARAVDVWYDEMDGAWGPWLEEIDAYRALVAALIGCARADAVVPKTNAGQGLRAVLNAFPADAALRGLRVVTTAGEFDSVDFILKSYAARGRVDLTRVPVRADRCVHGDDVIDAIGRGAGRGVDLVVVSQVYFGTGQRLEGIERVVRAAHDAGAKVLVDTYHSAGVMAVGFDGLGADFAIGGNYKYTRGGAGACWLAVSDRHLRGPGLEHADSDMRPIDTGWFAKEDTFAYRRPDEPRLAGGGDGWLESTPPVLTAPQARAGLEFTLAVGLDRLRVHNLDQQRRLVERLHDRGVGTWRPPEFGAFVCVPSLDIAPAASWLREHGLNIDARPWAGNTPDDVGTPGVIRLCPDVLTTDEELTRAADLLGGCPVVNQPDWALSARASAGRS